MLPTYEQFRATKTFGSLDGLRGLSIIVVVWHHLATNWMPGTLQGYISMRIVYLFQFFFVISGFLITTLLLREKEKYGQISLRNFHIRRGLRIFPLYYTVIVLYILTVKIIEPNSVYGIQFMNNLKYYLTYTSNWFVSMDVSSERVIFYFAWALATEMQFYLIWPVVENNLKRYWPVLVALAMIAIQQVAANGLLSNIIPADSLLITVARSISAALCLGVILAHIMHSKRGFNLLRRFVGRVWISPLALLMLSFFIVILNRLTPINFLLIFVGMAIVVASCVIREDHLLRGVLSFWPARLVGTVSYGIYLLHMLTYNAVKRVLAAVSVDNLAVVFGVTLIAATFVAWLSYHYYETYFLRMKPRFSRSA